MSESDINASMYGVAPLRSPGRPPIKDGRDFEYITPAEQLERWQRVRHVLRTRTKHQIDKHFDMSAWLEKTHCGTVGCAAGLCALDPWFNRRGYSVDWSSCTHTTIDPEDFFGNIGYREVFVNQDIMHYRDRYEHAVNRTPREQHRRALRATNQYIKQLKANL